MKLCKDCKWYSEGVREQEDLCTHAKSSVGYVRQVRYNYCGIMRGFPCGPEASLWEPRYEQNQEAATGATGTSSLAGT
jgi:hypothetical protein